MLFKQSIFIIFLVWFSPWLSASSLLDSDDMGAQLIRKNCLGCHLPTEEGLSRISYQRKTPEGWEMTIKRMGLMHGLTISNQEIKVDNSALHEMVKYLADTQGLAPEETEGRRFLLEQDNNRVEQHDDETFGVMCARCHSGARVALQRRAKKEWNYLIDFHLGQWPSTEYSLFGRDRNWLKDAREKMLPYLSTNFPLQSKAWQNWQNSEKADLSGKWVLSGHMPAKGFFTATMQITAKKPDYYQLQVNGKYANGEAFQGSGSSVVYTGYEWRGVINFGDIKLRQTLAADQSGSTLTGRFYQHGQEHIGMEIHAIKNTDTTQLISVYPQHIKRGETQTLLITGTGLTTVPRFSKHISLVKVLEQNDNFIRAQVKASATAETGYANIKLANAELKQKLAVYNQVDNLQLSPSYAVARIGGNGGSNPKVNAMFRAYGVDYGKDGKANTEDDIHLGVLEAVRWHVVPRDEIAKEDQDVKFAGMMDANTGIFQPADAGPNPKRKRSTNNAGNLNVIATFAQNQQQITAQGRLLVTVQRWNNPPLK